MKAKGGFNEKSAPYILLIPLLFTLIIFFGYAFVRSFYFSFTNYNMFNTPELVGFSNYIGMFNDSKFFYAVRNTIYFAFIVTACQTFGSLLLAVIMNQKIKGMRFFRAVYYLPSITSSVVITLIFMWFFQKRGIINFLSTVAEKYILTIVAFIVLSVVCHLFLNYLKNKKKIEIKVNVIFLSVLVSLIIVFVLVSFRLLPIYDVLLKDTVWLNTRATFPAFLGKWGIPRPLLSIMILNIWTTIPTMSLIYLAGLQGVSPSLYEAARIDGANKVQQFFKITIPSLSNITFLVVTMGLIGTFQMFDQVAIIGSSAPLESTITLAYYVYNSSFPGSGISEIGKAAAAANILAILTLIVVTIQHKLSKT